jgi:hypothetical protein
MVFTGWGVFLKFRRPSRPSLPTGPSLDHQINKSSMLKSEI